MVQICKVCEENVSKYKCSTCFTPYCCLVCWKIHKTGDNCKAKKVNQDDNLSSGTDKKKFFTEDTVSEEKLNELGKSEFLKKILTNRYLQSTLIAIDNSSNPEEAIKQAMKDSEFVEFVDECLKIVDNPPD